VFVSTTREAVERLLRDGFRPSEIARHLGLAPQTISYHVARIQRGAVDGRRRVHAPVEIDESIRQRPTRAAVAELLEGGMRRTDVARVLDISKATVSYHARRLGLELNESCARRYDWAAILCPNCHSQTENFAGRNGRRAGGGIRGAGGVFRGWRGGRPRRVRLAALA
jgi:DNA-binding CsgD family transcriptional regulator